MALKDFFNKKNDEEIDPLKDLVIAKLRVGYLLDYDLKTWEVTAYYLYDFGEGYEAHEWELTSGNEKWYLERSVDDEVELSLSKKIPIGAIEGDIRRQIKDNDDPPGQIVYKDKKYFLDESGTGNMYKDGKGTAEEFAYWDFIDEEDENFLTIEQWDENEFEAGAGFYVEEYQFSNILPGNPK